MRYVNTTYRRTGTFWEGRFTSSIVESERYVLTCYRYLELHPVRAGLVGESGDYIWSSYRYHALGEWNGLIQDHEVYLALGSTVAPRCQAYQALVLERLRDPDVQAIRSCQQRLCVGLCSFSGRVGGDAEAAGEDQIGGEAAETERRRS